MTKQKRFFALLIALFLLSGCTVPGSPASTQEQTDTTAPVRNTTSATADATTPTQTATSQDMFTNRDLESTWSEMDCAYIQLNGTAAACDSDAVTIDGSTVTITDQGTYVLSGTLDDGMVIVNAHDSDKLQIVLCGVSITSSTSAALYILEADKVFLTLAEGTENTLSNGGSFEAIDENNIDGALFSKQDLTLNGSGSLTVQSPAGHGIVCKDDLVFTGGSYTINTASHGLDANDSVRITNASLNITAGKDGIHAENSDDASLGFVYTAGGTVTIDAQGDGISAGSYAQIDDGTFTITAGGGSENGTKTSSDTYGDFMGGMDGRPGGPGRNPMDGFSSVTEETDDSTSMKGMKAQTSLLVNAGNITIDSADDALHANDTITVNNGTFQIASGDDGFHADTALNICSGIITITESYEGLEALQVAVSGGDITLYATDDGINAAGGTDQSGFGGRGQDMFGGSSDGSIIISGGNLYVQASGDGIDSNGYLEITGGYTVLCGPTQGDTAVLDYDTTGTITGGTFIGTGSSSMAQSFSSAQQGVVAVSVGNQQAGTQITLTDTDGNTVISLTPALSFAIVILSSPDIVSGQSYTVTVGSQSGTIKAN